MSDYEWQQETTRKLDAALEILTRINERDKKLAEDQQQFDTDLNQLQTDFNAANTVLQTVPVLIQSLIAKLNAAGVPVDLTAEDTIVKSMDSAIQGASPTITSTVAAINAALTPPSPAPSTGGAAA